MLTFTTHSPCCPCVCVQPVICTCVGSEAPPLLELRLTYTRYLSTTTCMQSILSVSSTSLPYLTPFLPLTFLYFSSSLFNFLPSSPPLSTSLAQNENSVFSLLAFSFPFSLPSHCPSSISLTIFLRHQLPTPMTAAILQ